MLNVELSQHWDAKIFENFLNLACWLSLETLAECFQMSTHVLGFQSFFMFLHPFVLAKLVTSSVRVNTRYYRKVSNRHFKKMTNKRNVKKSDKIRA